MSGPVAGIGDTLISATLGVTKPITGLVTDTLGKTTIGKVINPLLNIGTKTATAGSHNVNDLHQLQERCDMGPIH